MPYRVEGAFTNPQKLTGMTGSKWSTGRNVWRE
jgi:hypothetical protein